MDGLLMATNERVKTLYSDLERYKKSLADEMNRLSKDLSGQSEKKTEQIDKGIVMTKIVTITNTTSVFIANNGIECRHMFLVKGCRLSRLPRGDIIHYTRQYLIRLGHLY